MNRRHPTHRNGRPHLALLNKGGGGLLVKGGDGVGDDGDLALHGGLFSLESDGLVLQRPVAWIQEEKVNQSQ